MTWPFKTKSETINLTRAEYDAQKLVHEWDGWSKALRQVRISLRDLADGQDTGMDTEVAVQLHRVIRRATMPHPPENMWSLEDKSEIECGLCGKPNEDPIHLVKPNARTHAYSDQGGYEPYAS